MTSKTNENTIKIVICDDLKQVCNYFKAIIDAEEDMSVVGVSYSGHDVLKIIEKTKPHIVLMDIQMESNDAGIKATEKIKEKYPDIKVIILTIHKDDVLFFKAYTAGAVEYIVKLSPEEEILKIIRTVYKNPYNLRPELVEKLLHEFRRIKKQEVSLIYTLNLMSNLTNAEFEILKLLFEGKSRKEIAKERFVEATTINTQVTKILKKLDCTSTKNLLNLLNQLNFFDVYNHNSHTT